jgi:hypothetical protein
VQQTLNAIFESIFSIERNVNARILHVVVCLGIQSVMFFVCCISLLIERTLLQAIYYIIAYKRHIQQSGIMIIIARRYFAHQIDRNIQTFAGSGIVRYTIGCFEKDIEIYANYRRLLGWNVLCWCSIVAKAWLCEYGIIYLNWCGFQNDNYIDKDPKPITGTNQPHNLNTNASHMELGRVSRGLPSGSTSICINSSDVQQTNAR